MHKRQQYKLEALTRSRDILGAEAELGPLEDTEGRRLLDAAIADVNRHWLGQRDAENERRAAKARQDALAKELREQHMKPIAKYARAKRPEVPDFAALSESGRGLRGGELVSAARAMATAVEPVADLLVEAQFPADFVAQFHAAADALEKAVRDRATHKVALRVATVSIAQHLIEGRRAVAMLDAVVVKKLAGNEGLLEGWRQAKRVVRKPGVVAGSDGAVKAPSPSVATALTTS